MDNTLRAILSELMSVSQQLDQACAQIQQLQADYTDLKNQQQEAPADAVSPAVR